MAQSIFDNPITGGNPNDFNPYTIGQHVNTNITVSGIGRGPGISSSSGNDRYSAKDWSTSGSIDLNDYFYFTLTPKIGYKINLLSFSYTGEAPSSGPALFAFRSSLSGYSADIGAPNKTGTTISLSSTEYQNITASITFRFYGWNAAQASSPFSINDFTFSAAVALPIELTAFQVDLEGRTTRLSWTTATEANNDFFSLERSVDGRDFVEIGQVRGAGTSYEPLEYSFTDEHPIPGKNYYRLRQVDFDRQFVYSPIVVVSFGVTGKMLLTPQPASDELHILLEKPTQEDGQWQVFTMDGRLVLSGEIPAETTEYALQIAEIPEGVYLLRLSIGQDLMMEQFRRNK